MPPFAQSPGRTQEQRLHALKGANRVRTERAKLKRELKAGKVRIEIVLSDPPYYLLSAKVVDVIIAVPKYGRVRANRILTQCRISPSKTIGGLTKRQRVELIKQLRAAASIRAST